MAFKIPTPMASMDTSPETLFRDLRNRTVEGLLSQQADMLRAYMLKHTDSDVALELPTGSGKTLVGLLIAEWRRRKYQERCVMLCPTRQLVHQVVAQASEKYGIDAIGFTGSQRGYSERNKTRFISGEAIAITTYSSLFNTKPFFSDAQTLIFDDAHSAENYVSSLWSLTISRKEDYEIFKSVWKLIEPHIPFYDRTRFDSSDEPQLDTVFVNKLPTPILHKIKESLISVLDISVGSANSTDLYHGWSMLRDHITACHLYYSAHTILIRPLTPPTKSFDPFVNAKQRVYMSATLGEGGDLERIFGREKISRIPAPEGWDKQGVGRRFIVFPMAFASEQKTLAKGLEWAKKLGRCLILTPSNSAVDEIKGLIQKVSGLDNFKLFSASDIETSKKEFVATKNAFAILANRYDGIDFLGEECRYLIVNGLPESTNLQERFFVSRLGSSVLFKNRIKTRVTQAIGRCTRSSTDYALVLVTGEKLNEFFFKIENRQILHPELQSEVYFGIEQSKEGSFRAIEDNINSFVEQNKEWKEADTSIISLRDHFNQQPLGAAHELEASVAYEVQYQDKMWNEDFSGAMHASKNVLTHLSGDALRGYRALWNYLNGNAAYLISDGSAVEVAKKSYSAAAAAAERLTWLKGLSAILDKAAPAVDIDALVSSQIDAIELLFEKLGKSSSKNIEKFFSGIQSGLAANDADSFELAQVNLGKLLGLNADNSSDQGAPDPWWFLGYKGIVFEDYTDTENHPTISKRKVLQAKAHPDFLKQKYPYIQFDSVFCSRTEQIDSAAIPHAKDLMFLNAESLQKWADNAISIMRDIWLKFPGAGNLEWKDDATKKICSSGLDSKSVFAQLTERKIEELCPKHK
ncbi:DEAD/DEAH box helicase [Desulfovibrio desulfuricans]|uniref:DEAD/DEAH box helicase n=1 Tax=Desulfovibrio desulfuricans TaxID=876 RepID=UPI000405A88A|nr:DEAD/DEAH box helicase [Desulfovibrio desulfuricans]